MDSSGPHRSSEAAHTAVESLRLHPPSPRSTTTESSRINLPKPYTRSKSAASRPVAPLSPDTAARRNYFSSRKMSYAFGSSTPREFSYLDHIPLQYRVYNVRLRSRRRKGDPTLKDYLREVHTSPTRRPRDLSVDSSLARMYAFGSCTPRELSYLDKVTRDLRVYDVRLRPAIDAQKRSKTTSFSTAGAGQGQKYVRRTSSMENLAKAKRAKSAPRPEHRKPPPAAVHKPRPITKSKPMKKATPPPVEGMVMAPNTGDLQFEIDMDLQHDPVPSQNNLVQEPESEEAEPEPEKKPVEKEAQPEQSPPASPQIIADEVHEQEIHVTTAEPTNVAPQSPTPSPPPSPTEADNQTNHAQMESDENAPLDEPTPSLAERVTNFLHESKEFIEEKMEDIGGAIEDRIGDDVDENEEKVEEEVHAGDISDGGDRVASPVASHDGDEAVSVSDRAELVQSQPADHVDVNEHQESESEVEEAIASPVHIEPQANAPEASSDDERQPIEIHDEARWVEHTGDQEKDGEDSDDNQPTLDTVQVAQHDHDSSDTENVGGEAETELRHPSVDVVIDVAQPSDEEHEKHEEVQLEHAAQYESHSVEQGHVSYTSEVLQHDDDEHESHKEPSDSGSMKEYDSDHKEEHESDKGAASDAEHEDDHHSHVSEDVEQHSVRSEESSQGGGFLRGLADKMHDFVDQAVEKLEDVVDNADKEAQDKHSEGDDADDVKEGEEQQKPIVDETFEVKYTTANSEQQNELGIDEIAGSMVQDALHASGANETGSSLSSPRSMETSDLEDTTLHQYTNPEVEDASDVVNVNHTGFESADMNGNDDVINTTASITASIYGSEGIIDNNKINTQDLHDADEANAKWQQQQLDSSEAF